jgi:hypothetical protein
MAVDQQAASEENRVEHGQTGDRFLKLVPFGHWPRLLELMGLWPAELQQWIQRRFLEPGSKKIVTRVEWQGHFRVNENSVDRHQFDIPPLNSLGISELPNSRRPESEQDWSM